MLEALGVCCDPYLTQLSQQSVNLLSYASVACGVAHHRCCLYHSANDCVYDVFFSACDDRAPPLTTETRNADDAAAFCHAHGSLR